MATQARRETRSYKILEGPSREALFDSLRLSEGDDHLNVTFKLDHTEEEPEGLLISVCVTGLKDKSHTSAWPDKKSKWAGEGWLPRCHTNLVALRDAWIVDKFGRPDGAQVNFNWNTRTRTGVLWIIGKET